MAALTKRGNCLQQGSIQRFVIYFLHTLLQDGPFTSSVHKCKSGSAALTAARLREVM